MKELKNENDMKPIKALVIVFSFLSIVAMTNSCEKNSDSSSFMYLIKVDSIKTPDNIKANKPFEITPCGIVGINLCYSFSHFKTEKLNNVITVESWGKYYSTSGVCADALAGFEGNKLNITLPEAGNYYVRMKRQDGTFLERQLTVE